MMQKKPPWLQTRYNQELIENMKFIMADLNLNTVCTEAACPNMGDCFARKTATFLILGSQCTRKCRFCNVRQEKPETIDGEEPIHLAEAVKKLGLKYAVITSVTRDDLEDGGAGQFSRCIKEVRKLNRGTVVEVLVPDFKGMKINLDIVIKEGPEVFGHNLETAERLYPKIRPEADYRQSLEVLRYAKKNRSEMLVKSGIMVGLGETEAEVHQIMKDAKGAGCDIFTIGQYLPPSALHAELVEYVTPEQFLKYKMVGEEMGFHHIASGPMVRSSYHAEECLKAGG